MKKQKKIEEEIEEVIDALIKDVHYEHTYPAHTAYYQLDFDKFRNALKEFSQKLLQRFIEETKVEEITAQNDRLGLKSKNNYKNGFNEALDEIKEKQQRWLRENL